MTDQHSARRESITARIRDALLSFDDDADLSDAMRIEAQDDAEAAVASYLSNLRWARMRRECVAADEEME